MINEDRRNFIKELISRDFIHYLWIYNGTHRECIHCYSDIISNNFTLYCPDRDIGNAANFLADTISYRISTKQMHLEYDVCINPTYTTAYALLGKNDYIRDNHGLIIGFDSHEDAYKYLLYSEYICSIPSHNIAA